MPAAQSRIFVAVKQVLFILFAICAQAAHSQSLYVRWADSAVKDIEKRDFSYRADSIYREFSSDSIVTKAINVKFMYADSRGKKLLMVDELKSASGDTTGIVYYFKDKELIKVCASIRSKNKTIIQSFYFKNNKLIFPDMYYGNLFEVDDYIEKSRKYLRFKSKTLHSNYIY
jgi:hypothetical protein